MSDLAVNLKKIPHFAFVAAMCVLSLGIILGINANLIPFGIPGMWVWIHKPGEQPLRMLFPLIGLALLLATLLVPGRALLSQPLTRQREIRTLGALWLSTFSVTIGVALIHPWGFMHTAALVFSIGPNSYYYTALRHPNLAALLSGFDQQMVHLPLHAQTQSAGPIVLCWTFRQWFEQVPFLQDIADVLIYGSIGVNCEAAGVYWGRIIGLPLNAADVGAALMVGLFFMWVGSLTVIPLYYLGKWLYNAQTGIWAAAGFVLVPSFHLFNATVDQMYPLVAMTALCLVTRAVRNLPQGWMYVAATGVLLAFSVFMSLGLLTLLPLCFVYACLLLRKEHPNVSRRTLSLWLLSFVSGLAMPWLLLGLVFRFNIIAVFLTSNRLRDILYAELNRSYWPSVGGNMQEFLISVGVPLALVFLWHLYRSVRDLFRRSTTVFANPLL